MSEIDDIRDKYLWVTRIDDLQALARKEAECAELRKMVKELEGTALVYCKEHKTIGVKTPQGLSCCINADLTRQLEGYKKSFMQIDSIIEGEEVPESEFADTLVADVAFWCKEYEAQLEEARKALEGEFDPHEHPLLVQIEYLRSKLEEAEGDKQKYYELWQNAIQQAAIAGKEK